MVKGFRPGKEPPQLKKRRAKQQYGDVTATQERLIELFAERTPEQSRGLIRVWTRGLLISAIVLFVVAGALAVWSLVAMAVVGVLALVVAWLWWRLHRQREAFEAMADTVAGGRSRKRNR